MESTTEYNLIPIGKVEIKDNVSSIVINKEYISCLKYLSLFSHAIIIYLENIKPNNPFSQRNIKIISIDERSGIVCFHGSQYFSSGDVVYDIKPYFPCEDRVKEYSIPKYDYSLPACKVKNIEPKTVRREEEHLLTDRRVYPIGNIRKIKGEFLFRYLRILSCIFKNLKDILI